jgi:outer membrane lipoprotein-sorting protein
LRGVLCVLLAAGALQSAELPGWWRALPGLTQLESGFIQESESAVFGKLRKEGKLQLAKGGRLRVTYVKGMILVCDGSELIQFDPTARTAQRLVLRSATKDMPLLNILVDPAALELVYVVKAGNADQVLLEPKRKDQPRVVVEGQNGFLSRVTWTDGTGAKQVLELKNPHIPRTDFPPAFFTFKPPTGTRWIG